MFVLPKTLQTWTLTVDAHWRYIQDRYDLNGAELAEAKIPLTLDGGPSNSRDSDLPIEYPKDGPRLTSSDYPLIPHVVCWTSKCVAGIASGDEDCAFTFPLRLSKLA